LQWYEIFYVGANLFGQNVIHIFPDKFFSHCPGFSFGRFSNFRAEQPEAADQSYHNNNFQYGQGDRQRV